MKKMVTLDVPKDGTIGCFRDAKTNKVLMCAFNIDKPCDPNCVACDIDPGRCTEHGSTSDIITCKRGKFSIGYFRK